jgi:hypothetical protein
MQWIGLFFVALGLLHGTLAEGQSASCHVAASLEKTHVFVREVDQDGNPLEGLASGWIEPGDRMPIASRTGKIVINYQLSSSDKGFKMDPVECSNGGVISVP